MVDLRKHRLMAGDSFSLLNMRKIELYINLSRGGANTESDINALKHGSVASLCVTLYCQHTTLQ